MKNNLSILNIKMDWFKIWKSTVEQEDLDKAIELQTDMELIMFKQIDWKPLMRNECWKLVLNLELMNLLDLENLKVLLDWVSSGRNWYSDQELSVFFVSFIRFLIERSHTFSEVFDQAWPYDLSMAEKISVLTSKLHWKYSPFLKTVLNTMLTSSIMISDQLAKALSLEPNPWTQTWQG